MAETIVIHNYAGGGEPNEPDEGQVLFQFTCTGTIDWIPSFPEGNPQSIQFVEGRTYRLVEVE